MTVTGTHIEGAASEWMTTQDVQHALGDVSESTVRRLAAAGRITRLRFGHRTVRYTRRSVLALLDPHNNDGPATPHREPAQGGVADAPAHPDRLAA